jgi:hypothetical protein
MKPEDKTLGCLADAWNQFQAVENKHPDDLNDFRFHIHALQNLLYAHKYKQEVPESGMYEAPKTFGKPTTDTIPPVKGLHVR